MTAKGTGAIGSIMLYGVDAATILASVFVSNQQTELKSGDLFHGQIIDGGQAVDDVVIGCEGANHFVIHCHGNPILIQKIMQLLVHHGAQVTAVESVITESVSDNLIASEAAVEQLKAVTLEGVRIIQSQVSGGLSAAVKKWIDKLNAGQISVEQIRKQCREILNHSKIARLIIHGVKIVLAGPANSGKSTLLNTLAGGEKAIVSDIAGTTRDWVSVFIQAGPLRAEVIDTAGLGQDAVHDVVDTAAQQRTQELISQSDCVLWVEDCTEPSVDKSILPQGRPVIEVYNKSDLLIDKSAKSSAVCISAKTSNGVENLLCEIQRRLQVNNFDYTLPVVFSDRQGLLFSALPEIAEKGLLQRSLAELLGWQQAAVNWGF